MKIPKVSKFCGCIKLETGGLIIGCLGTVVAIFLMYSCVQERKYALLPLSGENSQTVTPKNEAFS